jgi:RimJ/RimL family protein N-acetyltransferase
VTAPTLADRRVRVRRLVESDLDAYLAAFDDDPDLLNLLGYDAVPTREALRRWFSQAWVDPPELRQWEFAVADAETDAFLGTIMIHSSDWKSLRAEVGALTALGARDRSVGSASFHLVLD